MSSLQEVRRRYGRDIPDLTPHTAGAEEPETTPDEIRAMIGNVFHEGHTRREQLDEIAKKGDAIESLRDGTYFIKYAHNGQYADFHDQANYNYLKEKYPFLHSVSEGLGFDTDEGEESHGDFESFLASIPHEDWAAFLEDMDSLEGYPLLDEDGASELEMKEVDRWVTEDGGPDLIKEMVKQADNSYDAYLLSKVPVEKVFEWMRESDHYPEAQGQGDVWMDMDKFAKESDTREWFLDEMEDDEAGWLEQKKLAYDDGAAAQFDNLLKSMAVEDEQVRHVYNRLDEEALWQLFLKAFPDERREEDDPYWYLWKPQYNVPGVWKPGFEADTHNLSDWKSGYTQALEDLKGKEWFHKLVRNYFQRGPEGHPEFKFEALEPVEDPDDPGIYMKYGGGLAEEVVYEDSKIVVLYPRDYQTLNHHLRQNGMPEITEQTWRDIFKYKDIFIIQGKQPVDLLGHESVRELAVIWGDSDVDLRVWTGSIKRPTLNDVLANPEYGKSIRRMLLRYYRERAESDSKAAHVLLQLGGARELRRIEQRGISMSDMGVALGLHYVAKHKYKLAAKAFNRSPSTMTAQGVWLIYDSVEDLTGVFKNEEAATTVFAHDHYDWFDHYYERSNRPKVADVIPFLDQSAIDHIRSVMVNRRVWFPDGGPDERGEYVTLTKKVLADYDDATILDWLANPSDEDESEGVFDDIIEAIQLAGVDILQGASQDNVYTGYIKAAVDAIDGKEHKWTNHPTKKYKTGEPMEAFKVFVPWKVVFDWAEKYRDEHGYNYDGDLESLAVNVNAETADPDINNMEADWRDVNKEWAKENLHRIHELEPPDPVPGSPDYQDPNQLMLPVGESIDDLDRPELMPGAVEGFPPDFRRQVEAIINDAYDYGVGPIEIKLSPYFPPSEEEIDASDGRLMRMRDHQTLSILYDPGQEVRRAESEAFQKIKGTVINTFRWMDLNGAYAAGPNPDEGESETQVAFWFILYVKPKRVPPEPVDDGDVPF